MTTSGSFADTHGLHFEADKMTCGTEWFDEQNMCVSNIMKSVHLKNAYLFPKTGALICSLFSTMSGTLENIGQGSRFHFSKHCKWPPPLPLPSPPLPLSPLIPASSADREALVCREGVLAVVCVEVSVTRVNDLDLRCVM